MLKTVEESAEALLLRRALDASGHDPARAASSLGLTVRTFGQRLKEHGISLET
jgi:transcriptional regulator with GAF, ATPase, and Fis domain